MVMVAGEKGKVETSIPPAKDEDATPFPFPTQVKSN